MRILFRGAAVRRPARMSNAVFALDRIQLQRILQIAQLARGAPHAQALILAVDGYASRVVAAIFQSLQSFENDGNSALLANIPHNSTHESIVRTVCESSQRYLSRVSMR